MPVFCNNCGQENRDTSKFCSGCGGTLQISSPSGPLASGTLLENRYKIVTLIKVGGMGAVYKAVDEKLDRVCAVKELLPPYVASPQELIQSAEWFKREAKILAKLSNANLPAVIDYFTSNGRYYLAMEFIEGTDLETLLLRDGNPGLPVEKVIDWSKQILVVLEYLHSQTPPIVYRDIKPGNIMLHKDGRAMLIDFGIARVVNEVSKTKKTAIGTAGYAPVEQCRGEAEPRSDLYALGASMHHLISGVEPLPFRFEPLSKHVSGISSDLNDIVMKALKDNIVERFACAREMRKSIEEIGGNGSIVFQKKVEVKSADHQPVFSYYKPEVKSAEPPPTAPMSKPLIAPAIVKQSINTIAPVDCTGWTLHKAAKEGKTEIIKILISKGADVNSEDNNGYTPLFLAIDNHFIYIAELLISKGANINNKDCMNGYTPLHLAINKSYKDIAKLLISRDANVNVKDNDGFTPLHLAAYKGYKKIVELLIPKRADVNAKDNLGNTPLHQASLNDHKEIVELLILNGVDVNVKDTYGNTPLYWAFIKGHKEIVELLISKGADVNSKDKDGYTPLHRAIKNYKIAELLISKGADVNAKDKDGYTPLHRATDNGSIYIAELLLSKGADVNTKSNSGSTPLSVAKTDEIKNLLISHGAKSSSCFITTAVCSSLHKPDDCYELNTFRKFRDNWLQYQPDGEYLIDEYYSIAPAIVKAINNMPQKDEIYKLIWINYLSKCLSMIESKNFEGAKKVYVKMVKSLKGVKKKKY